MKAKTAEKYTNIQTYTQTDRQTKSLSYLPCAYICSSLSEGSLAYPAQLEGIAADLNYIVDESEDSGQRKDSREEKDVAELEEELKVVIKCSLEKKKKRCYNKYHKYRNLVLLLQNSSIEKQK